MKDEIMIKVGKTVAYTLGFIVACIFLGLFFALPTKWLLNWLVPILFQGAAGFHITWLQAWGVNIICNILFKGSNANKSDSL